MEKFIFFLGLLTIAACADTIPKCPKNEVYSECGNNGCENTCDYPNREVTCKSKTCYPGCVCKSGYLRNSNRVCVPANQCVKCGANEVYSECGNNACQNTCANPNIGKVCKAACKAGCICKDGYLRNTKGVCVPAKKCDTCGVNEIFDLCGNPGCDSTCDQPDLFALCDPIGCNAGCICKEGYLRNKDKKCVKPEECPPKCQNPNEEFQPCGDVCPITCANKDSGPRICPAVCKINGGCVCKPGFVRRWDRKCIKPEECPTCKGTNEFYSCGSACDTTCATLGEVCPIVNIKCTEMCYCKEGYARDSNKVCIPIEDCPPKQCESDPNAIVLPCGDPCPLTCNNKDDKNRKPCKECIENGCKCKDGYVLNRLNGKCILAKTCPPKLPIYCGPNAFYDVCPSRCPPERTCSNFFSGLMVKCAPTEDCIPACRCKENYFRNKDRKCIKLEACCTDPNSELVDCPNGCPGGTCKKPEFDECNKKCASPYGCQCKHGFVKKSDTDPKCIAINKCKKRNTSKYE